MLEVTGLTPIMFFLVNDEEYPVWRHRTLTTGRPTCTATDPTLAATAQYLLALDHLTEIVLHHWNEKMERTRAAKAPIAELVVENEAAAHRAHSV